MLKECSHDVIMMGTPKSEPELFNYAINLEKRVRANHPLRGVKAAIDFRFVREEVAHCYGKNGNESVPPEVILKMMFLLFFDDIKSERELMEVIGERLDYLWFLDYALDEKVPDHSVLSKARARWGKQVFESLFVRTVGQCVEEGLVDGGKLHVDGSLVDAHASTDSVIKAAPALIAALKRAYGATESKLDDKSLSQREPTVNERMMSQSDPDATLTHQGREPSRPRYKHHRVIDDAKGVITAVETTAGKVAENKKLMDLIDQHEKNTHCQTQIVVADCQYGTSENFVACQERGITTHMGDAAAKVRTGHDRTLFGDEAFHYDEKNALYRCPAGQSLKAVRFDPIRQRTKYKAPARVCRACALRAQCTRSLHGRSVHRHEKQQILNVARGQSHSAAARRHRRRRRHLMEQSFADASNNHHFKRARWRRLWRQQIQDYLIASIQNVRILLAHHNPKQSAAAALVAPATLGKIFHIWCIAALELFHFSPVPRRIAAS